MAVPEHQSSELLEADSLIRRLKKGAPLHLEKETVRLPRFTEIREVDQSEVGGRGKEPLVIARARTATWVLLPSRKKTGVTLKDARSFKKLLDALQEQNPQKPVKGYLLTSGAVKDEATRLLEPEGHLASTVAE